MRLQKKPKCCGVWEPAVTTGLFELYGLTVHCVLFVYKEEIRELPPSVKVLGGFVVGSSADICGIMCSKAPEKRLGYSSSLVYNVEYRNIILDIIKYKYVKQGYV